MSLQAKLTLGSVLLATLIVLLVSAVDLGNLMQFQFNSTLERAELVKLAATEAVKDALNRPRQASVQEAVRDPALNERLLKLLGQSKTISEIVVVSQSKPEVVLASTVSNQSGHLAQDWPDFNEFVTTSSWWDKASQPDCRSGWVKGWSTA